MDRAEFIITVYCLVCEQYQVINKTYRVRRGGFAPALSDEEVMTRELCGEYFKRTTDKDLFAYFRAHYAPFFPTLTDRTLFVRPAANLWHVKVLIHPRLTPVSGQSAEPVQIIDTVPLPVWGYIRSGRGSMFSDGGRLRALRREKPGLLWLQIGPADLGTGDDSPRSSVARPHDIRLLDDLVEGFAGLVPADKGFFDAYRHAGWPRDMAY